MTSKNWTLFKTALYIINSSGFVRPLDLNIWILIFWSVIVVSLQQQHVDCKIADTVLKRSLTWSGLMRICSRVLSFRGSCTNSKLLRTTKRSPDTNLTTCPTATKMSTSKLPISKRPSMTKNNVLLHDRKYPLDMRVYEDERKKERTSRIFERCGWFTASPFFIIIKNAEQFFYECQRRQ